MSKDASFSYTAAYETVRTIGRLLAPEGFDWLTEIPDGAAPSAVVLHLSCMAHYTPHIPQLGQQILQRLGLDCLVVGGPEFCCGALHLHFGDEDLGKQTVAIALHSFAKVKPQKVFSICPDCDEIFAAHGRPQRYAHRNVSELLLEHLDRLKPLMRPVPLRIIAHSHHANEARRADGAHMLQLLRAVPGLEIIEAEHSAGPGVHCQTLHPMSDADQRHMFDEARALKADALVVPYHSCFRQHCKMQLSHGVAVHHYFGILAMALGIPLREPFKDLRLLDDLDGAVTALEPRIAAFGYDRDYVRAAMARTVYR